MSKKESTVLIMVLVFSLLFINLAEAHVCDDVLRSDPIVIWPEKQIVEISQVGQFKIFLKNGYGASIHQVRLIIPPSPFEISTNPPLIEKVEPREEVFFLVNLSIPQEVKSGTYPLLMEVGAREFTVNRKVNLNITVEVPAPKPKPKLEAKTEPKLEPEAEPQTEPELEAEPEAVVEIIPEEIPIAISVLPNEIGVEAGQSTELRVFVRSGYSKSLHNITLFINESRFKVKITPTIIEELTPKESKFFLIHLTVPPETEMGDYVMPIEFSATELPVKRWVRDVRIRVGKVWEEKTYLYLLIILFIILILVWRWGRIKKGK